LQTREYENCPAQSKTFCYKADLNVCVQQPKVTVDVCVGNLSAFLEATVQAGKS